MKHFKRLISVILALLMMISGAPLTALADEPQEDISGTYVYEDMEEYTLNWSYTASTDTLYLDGKVVFSEDIEEKNALHLPLYYEDEGGTQKYWSGTYKNIVFSKNVEALNQLCIGFDLLDNNVQHNIKFETGSKLEYVDDYAFYGANLNEVRLPKTVHHIGFNAFSSCNIHALVLPAYVGEEDFFIDVSAFSYSYIDFFDFNKCPITEIPDWAFLETELNTFYFAGSIEYIGEEAFRGTKFKYDIFLPDDLEEIGVNAFEGAEGIGCYFPNNDTPIKLYSSVFENSKFKIVDFNDCYIKSEIPYNAFKNAEIDTLILTDSIKYIFYGAFEGAKIGCNLVLPESLNIIDQYAFESSNIKKITFSQNIKTIEKYAFRNCHVEEESVFAYIKKETNIKEDAFIGSNIIVEEYDDESPYSVIDYEQHDVSGSFRGFASEETNESYYIDWSYDIETDTLYIDTPYNSNGGIVKSFDFVLDDGRDNLIAAASTLPLFYENGYGKTVLWAGKYHNIVFSNNVTKLEEGCYGNTAEPLNIAFEENSKLEIIGKKAFFKANINSIVLPDSVYCIGESAFQDSALENIKLPSYKGEEKPEIQEYAFLNCKNLTVDFNGFNLDTIGIRAFYGVDFKSLTIPDTVNKIEAYGFYQVSTTGDIIIPDTVTEIEHGAFYKLTCNKVFIGKNVKTIGQSAFYAAKFTQGIEFSSEISELDIGKHAFSSSNITSFNFTKSIKSMDEGVFYYCRQLLTVTADDDCIIEEIPKNLFNTCTQLKSVEIPNSVTKMEYAAFRNTTIASITFQSNSKLERISHSCFEGCGMIKTIDIPDSVKQIGYEAFKDCRNLKTVNFGENSKLEKIDYSAFQGLYNFESIVLPEGLKTIGSSAFRECNKLKSVQLPSTLTSIGSSAFNADTNLESINIPSSLTTISNNAFYKCSKLSITLPDNITQIGNYAFYNCRNISNVPKSLKVIGDYAFYNCNGLNNVELSKVKEIGMYAFFGSGIKRLDFSTNSNKLMICDYAFQNCHGLEYVSFKNCSLDECGTNIFDSCEKLATVVFPGSMPIIPYSFLRGTALSGDIVLPFDVSRIDGYAFSETKINSINISGRVKRISAYAFYNCVNLSDVTIEENPEYTELNKGVFQGCTALKTVSLPESIDYIPENCFKNSGLTSINIPLSVESIGNYAFSNTKISTITINSNIEVIGEYAFENCTQLYNVIIPENSVLEEIREGAFKDCSRLSHFVFTKMLRIIGAGAFRNCSLTQAIIPTSVTTVNSYAFADNPLKTVAVLHKNTEIKDYSLFYNSSDNSYSTSGKLFGYNNSTAKTYAETNSIPFISLNGIDDVEEYLNNPNEYSYSFGTWGNGTWNLTEGNSNSLYIEGSGDIDSIVIKDDAKNTKTFAELANEYDIKNVFIGEGITAIPDYFLYDDEGVAVEFVQLPNSLKSIGDWAFAGTSVVKFFNSERLDDLKQNNYNSYIPQSVARIGKYAFALTDGLNYDFELPRELTEISEGLFYKSNVKSVSMCGKVTKIGKKAFVDCSEMTELYIPMSATEIYYDNDINNSAFGYSDGVLNTKLTVFGRINSFADSYCTDKGIHFAEHRGRAFRSGYIADLDVNRPNAKLNWEFFIEDNSLVFTPDNEYEAINMKDFTFAEKNSDKRSHSVFTLSESSNINLSPDKIIIDETKHYYAPNLLAMFNPSEFEFCCDLQTVGDSTFENCTEVEEIYFPDSVSTVGKYAFANCNKLKKVSLGSGIYNIPEGLFYECRNIEAVDLGNVVLQNIRAKAFYNCNSLKFVNLTSKTDYTNGTIGEQAFYNCVNLQEINIPNNIKTIGEKAFYNCVQVQSITLSGKVTSIEKDAFANLFYCESITINSEVNPSAFSGEKDIFNNLGAYTNGIELNVGSDVNSLNCEFFKNLKITKINLGSGLSALSNKQYLSKLKEITADENANFSVKTGLLYRGSTLVLAPQALTQVSIDSETKIIDDYAFCGTNAKSVTLPDSVISIGEGCFENSKALVGITLSEGLTAISKNAFKDCTKLRLLNLPENTVLINQSAFEGCTSLVSAVFNNSLSIIGKNAFKDCARLEGLAFPENLSSIAEGAFMNCAGLKYAYIWNAQIGENAFAFCDKLNIFTPVGTDAYRYAREFDIPYSAYTDEELFFDEWAIKIDALAGYLGYCEEDGHGDIEYLTVYEADCEHDGYVIGVCEYCSEILEEIHIDAYGHNYRAEADIPATATTRGISVYTCENCNQSYTTYSAPLDDNFETETHSVSGRIALSADKTAATGLAPVKGASIVIDGMTVATSDENGDFSFEIETGTYEAQIRYAYGFTRTIYIQMRNHDLNAENPIVIIGCDFSKDGRIDDEDIKLFSMIISAKKNDPSYLRFVDMNGDGHINAKDMLYINACQGITSQGFRYPPFIIS